MLRIQGQLGFLMPGDQCRGEENRAPGDAQFAVRFGEASLSGHQNWSEDGAGCTGDVGRVGWLRVVPEKWKTDMDGHDGLFGMRTCQADNPGPRQAGWQGKSRVAALRQSMVDGITNSSCEGFRLEVWWLGPSGLKARKSKNMFPQQFAVGVPQCFLNVSALFGMLCPPCWACFFLVSHVGFSTWSGMLRAPF